MRIKNPRTFGANVYASLMSSGEPFTQSDIMQYGLKHGLGFYKAKEEVEAMVDDGVLRRFCGAYHLTPYYEARRRRR